MTIMKNKKYLCVGESYKNGIIQGCAGDVHTLPEWIDICYGEKAKGYFGTYKEAIEYLQKYAGKTLKELKQDD